jgi:hypothetical protein
MFGRDYQIFTAHGHSQQFRDIKVNYIVECVYLTSHWSATVMTPLGKIQRAYIALYHILLYLR